jgi:hypothetical protein
MFTVFELNSFTFPSSTIIHCDPLNAALEKYEECTQEIIDLSHVIAAAKPPSLITELHIKHLFAKVDHNNKFAAIGSFFNSKAALWTNLGGLAEKIFCLEAF